MSNAKLQIYSAVLKQQRPFKASTIHLETGLSRSLIAHHLKKLIEEGFIERDSNKPIYSIVARNDLLDAITDVSANNVIGLWDQKPKFLDASTKEINYAIEASVITRCAGTVGALETKVYIQKGIDNAIDDLKKLRRYLNSKTYSQKAALNRLENERDSIWEAVKYSVLKAGFTRDDWDNSSLQKEQELA